MKRSFKIINEEVRARAAEYIYGLPLEPALEVIIKPYKKDRTLSQNSLYWVWMTFLGGELGDTKLAMDNQYKKLFLSKIYERDDPEYAKTVQTVREVYKWDIGKANILYEHVIRETSTTTSNIKQFTEYLDDIEKDCISKQIILPHPSDYRDAMGVK